MTGITKDELMQMAREAGIEFKPMRIEDIEYKYREVHFNDSIGGDEAGCIELLLNAILERAAWNLEDNFCNEELSGLEAAEEIRALKINTGD